LHRQEKLGRPIQAWVGLAARWPSATAGWCPGTPEKIGPNFQCLQQVKKKYDPSNVFHHAMSIRALGRDGDEPQTLSADGGYYVIVGGCAAWLGMVDCCPAPGKVFKSSGSPAGVLLHELG
jgi:hypothetical protein